MPQTWFACSTEEVVRQLGADPRQGLNETEARERLRRYGPNALEQVEPLSWRTLLVRQLKSLIVALLAAAAIVSFLFGEYLEAGAILGVLVLNTLIGFVVEWRAQRSMEALRRLVEVTAKVCRGGALQEVPAHDLVPGDLLALEAGDLVSADARVLEANSLAVDESSLTGESVPVDKSSSAIADPGTPLAERINMLYGGTTVVRGSARALVVATGAETELGEVARLVGEAAEQETPLQRRLEALGRTLVWIVLGVAVVVVLAGVWTGKAESREGLIELIETAVALSVAAIPEGLPVVATIALAIGLREMARKKALVSRLDAVETLGSTRVIATDKTGTLTENSMRAVSVLLCGEEASVDRRDDRVSLVTTAGAVDPTAPPTQDMLLACVLCNNAAVRPRENLDGEWETVGDPTEAALLVLARELGLESEAAQEAWPREREVPFDSETKCMVTVHRAPEGGFRAYVKGAPGVVVPACTHELAADGGRRPVDQGRRGELERRCEGMAERGLRVLALASKGLDSVDAEARSGLVFLGAVGLLDPPRRDVAAAIAACQGAGIRVVMVTGDLAATGAYVAREVGILREGEEVISGRELAELSDEELRRRLPRTSVFARVTPADKLRIVRAFQEEGEVVAVFGDGVNDAPALKQADIGVVMGQRGTQVAKEAGDLILQDDRLPTIVSAVEGGRVIFRNLRKFVVYLLSCNIAEVMLILAASLIRMPMPLKPLQILWLNLVTDVFPALALGMERYPGNVMAEKPRPAWEPFLGRTQYRAILGYGSLIAVCVLGAFMGAQWWLGLGLGVSITVAFFSLALAQVFFVLKVKAERGLRDPRGIFTNKWVWLSIGWCGVLSVGSVFVPGLKQVLRVEMLPLAGWLLVLVASLIPVVVGLSVNTVLASRARPKASD